LKITFFETAGMNYIKIAEYIDDIRDYFSLLSSSKTVYKFFDGCDKKILRKLSPPWLLVNRFPGDQRYRDQYIVLEKIMTSQKKYHRKT
jgi:hypothetical protein